MGKGSEKLKRIGVGVCKSFKFLLTPSLVTYFAQAGAIYLINGLYTMVSMDPIQEILCKIPGEWNETQGNTVGCSNCTDNLLMCGKDWCYKSSMNITIMKKNSGQQKSLNDMFLQATQDKECSLKIGEATNPIAAVVSIIDERARTKAATGVADPGNKCLQWHCQVLIVATGLDQGTDVFSPSGQCTNVKFTKPSYYDKTCICGGLPMTFDMATKINNECGVPVAGVVQKVLTMSVASKATCLRTSVERAAQAKASDYNAMALKEECVTWFQTSSTHHQWFTALASDLSCVGASCSGATASTYGSCTKVMCQAFYNSVFWKSVGETPPLSDGCTYGSDALTPEDIDYIGVTLQAVSDIIDQCQAVSANTAALADVFKTSVRLCNITKDGRTNPAATPPLCTEVWPAGSFCPGAKANELIDVMTDLTDLVPDWAAACLNWQAWLAGGRRMAMVEAPDIRHHHIPKDDGYGGSGNLASAKGLCGLDGCDDSPIPAATQAVKAETFSFQDMLNGIPRQDGDMIQSIGPSPSEEENELLQEEEDEEEDGRRLQDEAAAAEPSGGSASNDALPDYTTTAWSQCVCYQQCVQGSRNRDVTCKSDKCKAPMPPKQDDCLCTHCAACHVAFNLMGLWMTLFFQGFAGMLLFGAFYFADRVHEDDLALIRCCSFAAFFGMICKAFPVLMRIFVYVNMGQVIFLFIQTFVPMLPATYDCKTNMPLLILSAVNCTLWVCQICYGIYMKKKKPMPAQLHMAMPGGKIRKAICVPLRSIGP